MVTLNNIKGSAFFRRRRYTQRVIEGKFPFARQANLFLASQFSPIVEREKTELF